jgi:hypothetical protein
LLNGLRYLLHELSLSIFNTLNFLKHQSTLDSSEFSAASHRTNFEVITGQLRS